MQLKYTLFSSISMLAFSSLSVFSQTEKMNVLFLMADDMRPELGCYGVKEVKTPNIDRFAASGLLFQRGVHGGFPIVKDLHLDLFQDQNLW